MRISTIVFDQEHLDATTGRALAVLCLTTPNGASQHRCTSPLPLDAPRAEHRALWIKEAIRQLERMPEMRSSGARLELPQEVLCQALDAPEAKEGP